MHCEVRPERVLTRRVHAALENLRITDSDAYWRLLKSRSAVEGGIGHVYPAAGEEVATSIQRQTWYLFEHTDIPRGCTGAFGRMAGRCGIVSLEALPKYVALLLIDPTRSGLLELFVSSSNLPPALCQASFTTLLLKTHEPSGVEIVDDFYPGEPLQPTRIVQCEGIAQGKEISWEQASRLGVEYVRVA